MTRIAEYGDIAGQPVSKRIVIRSAPSNRATGPPTTYHLASVSEGWTSAGSMARWTKALWAVYTFDSSGTRHGQLFTQREDAEQLFELRTNGKDGAPH